MLLNIINTFAALLFAAASAAPPSPTPEQQALLQSVVNKDDFDLSSYNSCDLTSLDDDCQLDTLPTNTSTLITPNQETFNTGCINGGPFKIQIFPSPSLPDTTIDNNVLVYFEGGGACWDKFSYDLSLCSKSSYPQAAHGIFCRNGSCSTDEAKRNPFEDYTIVHITYCSGDAHVGDVARPSWSTKHDVVQKGAPNAQSAIRWLTSQKILEQQGLNKLAIMGCSAGSLGAQAWADEILYEISTTIGYNSAIIMPDSYAGVFPPGTESVTIKDFGACDTVLLAEEPVLQEKCKNEQILLQDMSFKAMKNNPDAIFAFINSKTDAVQRAYYSAVAATFPHTHIGIGPVNYYNAVNDIFMNYTEYANFLSFFVESDMHCYTNMDIVYTADAGSLVNNGRFGDKRMIEFISEIEMRTPGAVVQNVCKGVIVEPGDEHKHNSAYCVAGLERTVDL